GCARRSRQQRGLHGAARPSDWRPQSDRDESAPVADGLPDAIRQPAAGGRSRQPDRSRGAGHPPNIGRLPAGVRYPLIPSGKPMHKHRTLFVTNRGERHQQAALDAAPRELDVVMRRGPSKDELIALLPDAEFLVSERSGAIDADIIAAGSKLRL